MQFNLCIHCIWYDWVSDGSNNSTQKRKSVMIWFLLGMAVMVVIGVGVLLNGASNWPGH